MKSDPARWETIFRPGEPPLGPGIFGDQSGQEEEEEMMEASAERDCTADKDFFETLLPAEQLPFQYI